MVPRATAAFRRAHQAVPLPIWQECLAGLEEARLRRSTVYFGFGVPRGDGSAVIVVPGFLGTDVRLAEFRAWLGRIGYRGAYSGVRINDDCPNLLVDQVAGTIRSWARYTRKTVHLVGYSYGGLLARVLAARMPESVRSVMTLGTPFRGISAHPWVLFAADRLREVILRRHGTDVEPSCFTGACTCGFLQTLERGVPESVRQAAIYSRTDGCVDWRMCKTDDPSKDYEVESTHLGLLSNESVYEVVAAVLARSR